MTTGESIRKSWVYGLLNPVRVPVRAGRRSWRRLNRSRILRRRYDDYLRPTDVFLVGHPKSGNTWAAYMLGILLRDDRSSEITLSNVGEYVPVVHGVDHEIWHYEHLGDPRVFRNEQPKYVETYPRTVYLVRDPRAALLSYFHMYRVVCEDESMTLDTFIDQYLRDGCIKTYEPTLERWDRQVTRWLDLAEARPDAVMVVRYEDMVNDRRESLERLARFLDLEPDGDLLDLAVERGSFQSMRKVEEKHGAESYPGEMGSRGRFIRKGTIDSWREEMDPDVAVRISKAFSRPMARLGYAD